MIKIMLLTNTKNAVASGKSAFYTLKIQKYFFQQNVVIVKRFFPFLLIAKLVKKKAILGLIRVRKLIGQETKTVAFSLHVLTTCA